MFFDILTLAAIMVLIVSSIFIWVEIIELKLHYENRKNKKDERIRFEDKDFIWILKRKKWMRYSKFDDSWTILSSPPY